VYSIGGWGYPQLRRPGRAALYDNRVGELETAERGLDYGEFERSKEVLLCEELPL